MAKKRFTVCATNLPEHERFILKLIFAISEKSNIRGNAYTFSDAADRTCDIAIRDPALDGEAVQAAAAELLVFDVAPEHTDEPMILRPLIATRVLAVLDDATAPLGRATNVPTDRAVEPAQTPAAIDEPRAVEQGADVAPVSASDAPAIVHDESLSNPANREGLVIPPSQGAEVAAVVDSILLSDSSLSGGNALPVPDAASDELDVQPVRHATPKSPTRLRAIVVDDSPSVRKQLEIELVHFNVEVEYAATARQAIAMIDKKDYDVAFLDVMLPDWDGFQICKRIKSKSKNTKVIMLTGKATTADKLKGTLAGCDAYLVKPVGRVTFQTTVKNYLPLAVGAQALGV